MYGFQVSHISECMVSKCLTYPSAYSFSATHPCVSHPPVLIHPVPCPPSASHIQVSHISKCLTPPNVSHKHAYSFGVLCLQVPIRSVSHIFMPIRSAHYIPKCLTHSSTLHIQSVHSFGVTHPSVSPYIACVVSMCGQYVSPHVAQVVSSIVIYCINPWYSRHRAHHILPMWSVCLTICRINPYCPHSQYVSASIAHVVSMFKWYHSIL